MTDFEKTIKLLDECVEMISKINTSLKITKRELENEATIAEAECIVGGEKHERT